MSARSVAPIEPWFPRSRQELLVPNPTSGIPLATFVVAPRDAGRRPLLVLVPGGISAGSLSFGVSGIADRYARRGYTVVYFDPDGRGASDGEEAHGGFVHQDGLAAVVETAITLPAVDPERVALVSFSLGGVIAAGMLARHPDLPVRFYVDWEGPALRQHNRRILATQGAELAADHPGALDDDSWWDEREAARFMRQVAVPYQRVQSYPDHAQIHLDHARTMMRSATAVIYGGEGRAAWTRLNGNERNRLYDAGFEPRWLHVLPAEVAVYAYLVELLPPV
jgi:pimeloyl-ACP methyl ester carboxylesterase